MLDDVTVVQPSDEPELQEADEVSSASTGAETGTRSSL